MQENFAITASPVAAPSSTARSSAGSSSQAMNASTASAVVAVGAISVVARPACASTGGSVLNSSRASRPQDVPIVRAASRKTAMQARRKKGRLPMRTSQRLWAGASPLKKMASPTSSGRMISPPRVRAMGGTLPSRNGPSAASARLTGGCVMSKV